MSVKVRLLKAFKLGPPPGVSCEVGDQLECEAAPSAADPNRRVFRYTATNGGKLSFVVSFLEGRDAEEVQPSISDEALKPLVTEDEPRVSKVDQAISDALLLYLISVAERTHGSEVWKALFTEMLGNVRWRSRLQP